jgi:hypothetical protein
MAQPARRVVTERLCDNWRTESGFCRSGGIAVGRLFDAAGDDCVFEPYLGAEYFLALGLQSGSSFEHNVAELMVLRS